MSLLALLTPLVAPIASAWSARGERKAAANTQRVALLSSKTQANHSWEIAALEGEGWELPIIRLMAYLELSLCMYTSIFQPQHAQEMWTAIGGIPEWLLGMKLTVFAYAFASSPIKSAAAGLVTTRALKASKAPKAEQ